MKEGWYKVKLGDVFTTINGLWTGKKEPFVKVNVYTMANFTKDSEMKKESSPREVMASVSQYESRKLEKGDILIEKSGGGPNQPVGRAVFFHIENSENNTFSNFTTRLRLAENYIDKIDSKFVQQYLKYIYITGETEQFQNNSTNIRNLQLKEYLSQDLYYPSLIEQQRIVSILDHCFKAIDKAKANAEQNLQNAKELFESYLQGVFEKRGEGWEEKKLGEMAFVKSGGTPLRSKKEYWKGNISWYSSGELNNLYTEESARYINELALQNSNAKLFPKGSLLIGMYDTAALKMSILDRDGAFNQAIAGVKPNKDIDLIFVLHAINSIKPEVLSLRRGVRQKNLNLSKIKNIPISHPSIKEQQAIVQKLHSIKKETQKLEARYQKKIDDLEELKKSILQKAFAGELKTERVEELKEVEL